MKVEILSTKHKDGICIQVRRKWKKFHRRFKTTKSSETQQYFPEHNEIFWNTTIFSRTTKFSYTQKQAKTHQNQNFKVLVTKPVTESDRNLGLALSCQLRRHFCNYATYISTRCRSTQEWVISGKPNDWKLEGILQKKQVYLVDLLLWKPYGIGNL